MDCITIINRYSSDVFFFLDDAAVKINSLIKNGFIEVNNHRINLFKVLDLTPSFFGKVIDYLDEYVSFLHQALRRHLNNKKIIVWYSGGKDSTASLIIILKLSELINFKPYFVYLHVPLLDGQRNLRFVERVERQLSIDIIYDGLRKEKMLDLVKRRGLPFRGYRWCTYHAKIKIMRRIKRALGVDFEVRSERMFESQKRLKSLREYVKQKMFVSGSQFKPIYPLTVLDVVAICKEYNLIHPDYMIGCTRVSCSLCPYRSIVEIKKTFRDVEDQHIVDSILKATHRKWYSKIYFDIYQKYYLWRFSPRFVEEILLLKEAASKLSAERLSSRNISNMLSWIWKNKISAPIISFREIYHYIMGAQYSDLQILNLELQLNFSE